jgi:hypothetical protein
LLSSHGLDCSFPHHSPSLLKRGLPDSFASKHDGQVRRGQASRFISISP